MPAAAATSPWDLLVQAVVQRIGGTYGAWFTIGLAIERRGRTWHTFEIDR